MLANAIIAGAEAQGAKVETQESKILAAGEIADVTRDAILSKLKTNKGSEPVVVWSDTISNIQKRIFGGEDPAIGAKEVSAKRAYDEFIYRFDLYFDATMAAIKAEIAKKNLANALEQATSEGGFTVIVPNSLTDPLEDNRLRNAESIRGFALAVARANDKLLASLRRVQ